LAPLCFSRALTELRDASVTRNSAWLCQGQPWSCHKTEDIDRYDVLDG